MSVFPLSCPPQSSVFVSTAVPDSHSRIPPPPRSFIMNISQVYAIVIAGIFCVLLLINGHHWIARLVRYLSPLISKHLIYRYVLHRHRLVGPWSGAGVLVQLIYIAGNIFCFSFRAPTISQAGLRAGALSIINLILLFAGPHLGALADLLDVTLSAVRQIHRSAGVMAVLLAVFHVLVAISPRPSFALDLPQNLFAVIVSVQSHGHISQLTRCIGSISTGVHRSAFYSHLSQTLLRTLPPFTPCLVGDLCLRHLATPAVRQALSPPLLVYLSGVVSVHVRCPRRYHLLPEWFLPVWPSASPHHARIWCGQAPNSVSEAA